MSEKRIETLYGFTFGETPAYRLCERTPEPLRRILAFWITARKARDKCLKDRAEVAAHGLCTDHHDAWLEATAEDEWQTEATALKAIHDAGLRWHVFVVDGWYLYMSPSMDDDGRRLEPCIVARPLDGRVPCHACHGSKVAPGAKGLGPVQCGRCDGRGTLGYGVSRTARLAIEAAAERKAVAHVD